MSDPILDMIERLGTPAASQVAPLGSPPPSFDETPVEGLPREKDPILEMIERLGTEQAPEAPAAPAMPQVPAEHGFGPIDPADPDPAPQVGGGRRSHASVFADAVERNARQIQAAVPTLRGIYAESQGDQAGAAQFAADAAEIEKLAPDQYQEFQKIRGLEDFLYWANEKVGENVLTIPTIMAGGGAGGLAMHLVGKGLLSQAGARYILTKLGVGVGAFVPSAGLETAGTAQEQRQVTGRYNPEVSITAGSLKGALEIITPLMLGRWIKEGGKAIGKGIATGALGEGVTEFLQTETDIWARRYSDPSFDVWGEQAWWRRAGGTAAGITVGGTFGGVGSGISKIGGRKEDPERSFDADAVLSDERPVNWLWRTFGRKNEHTIKGFEEATKSDPLLAPLSEWGALGLTPEMKRRTDELVEANTKRYAVLPPGDQLGVRTLLNAADARVEEAKYPRHTGTEVKPTIVEVEQGALLPANITASFKDLPAADGLRDRLYFLPRTTQEEQNRLTQELVELIAIPDDTSQERYEALLNDGLRVIPSRGASFDYVGPFLGREGSLPRSGTAMLTRMSPRKDLDTGQFNIEVFEPFSEFQDKGMTVDLDRIPPGSASAVPSSADLKVLDSNELLFAPGVAEEAKPGLRAEFDRRKLTDYPEVLIEGMLKKGVYINPDQEYSSIGESGYARSLRFIPGFDPTPYLTPAAGGNQSPDSVAGRSRAAQGETRTRGDGKVTVGKSANSKTLAQNVKDDIAWARDYFKAKKVPFPYVLIKENTQYAGSLGIYYPDYGVGLITGDLIHQSKVFQRSTLFHELGHAITIHWWDSTPTEIQQKILADYQMYLLQARITRDPSAITPPEQFGDVVYYYTFIEWLAEQFRRVAETTVIRENYSDKNARLHKGAKLLMDYYRAIETREGEATMANRLFPSREFVRWMDWMETGQWNEQVRNKELSMFALSGRLGELDGNYNVTEMTEIVEQVIAEHGKRLFPEGVEVKASTLPQGALGYTRSGRDSVLLSYAAARFGAEGILSHEAVHVLKGMGLFTEAEWSALVRAARAEASIVKDVNRSYVRILNERANSYVTEGLLLPEERTTWVMEMLNEEYVGQLVYRRVHGMVTGENVSSILDRIVSFFRELYTRLTQSGYTHPDAVIRALWKGEIARRNKDTELSQWLAQNQPFGEAKALANVSVENNRSRWITPDKIEQVAPDVWVAREVKEVSGHKLVQYRFYQPPAGAMPRGLSSQLQSLGREIGNVQLTGMGAKGYEISMIVVHDDFARAWKTRGESYGDTFYNYMERDLQTRMKPSGVLLEDGYKRWKRVNPDMVRYHVHDAAENSWLSPNYLRKTEQHLHGLMGDPLQNKEYVKARLEKVQALLRKVDPKAWHDPELSQMFASEKTPAGFWDFMLRMGEKGLAEESGGPSLGFKEVAHSKMQEGKRRNARALGISEDVAAPPQAEMYALRNLFTRSGGNKQYLYGTVLSQADRIGWFSKIFMGLVQLAQVNPTLRPLQSYVEQVEAMNTDKMQWVSRADDTAKAWDKLPRDQRDGLAEMVFWLTEMNYRSAAEVQRKVVRHPTNAEIAAFVTRHRLTADTMLVYDRIRDDFASFLTETEVVSTAAIQREFVNNPQGLAAALAELAKDMAAMRAKPYFPMTRFGKYTLTVRDSNNKVVAFHAYPTIRDRDAAIPLVARQHPGTRMQAGAMPENVQEFQGLPPALLRRIKATFPNLTQAQREWLDRFQHEVAPERSFKKRWLERKGTPGYSLDALRAYSHYFLSGANYIAKLKHRENLRVTIDSFEASSKTNLADSTKRMEIIDYLNAHYKYLMEGGQDYAKLKSLIAVWYLGFSPVAAATNLSQIPLVTLPVLSERFTTAGTVKRAFMDSINALKASFEGIWLNAPWPGYEMGRQELIKQGKIDAGQAMELGAYAEGNNLVALSAGTATQKFFRQLSHKAMWMFQKAERFNRELTYAMTFKLAMESPNNAYMRDLQIAKVNEINRLLAEYPGMKPEEAAAVVAAADMIDRTQFIYSPYARPPVMQKPEVAVVLVFMQFVQGMLHTIRYDPASGKILLTLLATAGLMGLPFFRDLDEIWAAIARRMGYNFKPSVEARKYVKALTEGTMFDQVGPDLMLHGLSRYGGGLGLMPEGWGVPRFDMSANLGLGRIVPGLSEAARAIGTYSKPSEIGAGFGSEAGGAGFSYMMNLTKYLLNDPFTPNWKEAEKIMPRFAKAASKGARFAWKGKEEFRSGATFAEFDIRDPDDVATVVAQMLGATPQKLSSKWEALTEMRDTAKFYQARRTILYQQMYEAVKDDNPEGVDDVVKAIGKFNEDLAKQGLHSLSISASKVRGSMRSRLRGREMEERGLPAQKSNIPLYRQYQELYPGVIFEKEVK